MRATFTAVWLVLAEGSDRSDARAREGRGGSGPESIIPTSVSLGEAAHCSPANPSHALTMPLGTVLLDKLRRMASRSRGKWTRHPLPAQADWMRHWRGEAGGIAEVDG